MNFLGVPLGYAIFFIHKLVKNYGVSIIVFTVLLRLLLIPLYIKQQKATARMSAFNPLISEINKKYKNNPGKRNEELQNLYTTHKMNPGAGCLTSIIPMFILLGMLDVVYRPLTHILQMNAGIINKAVEILRVFDPICFTGGANGRPKAGIQLNLINDVGLNPSHYESLGSDFVDSVNSIDLSFLGFNLADPANLVSLSIIFPILALVFSFLQSFIMMKQNSVMPQAAVLGKVMLLGMPIFSFFLTLWVPLGLSVYWIVGYILQTLQSLFLNKICNYEEIRQNALIELERIKKNKKSDGSSNKQTKISNKERLRLAREKLNEKYGD